MKSFTQFIKENAEPPKSEHHLWFEHDGKSTIWKASGPGDLHQMKLWKAGVHPSDQDSVTKGRTVIDKANKQVRHYVHARYRIPSDVEDHFKSKFKKYNHVVRPYGTKEQPPAY